MMKKVISCFLILLLTTSFASAADKAPRKPTKKDKCPVCGMFVYKYPDWVGEIIFKDDSVFFFDGAKDLFKYYFNLKKYNPKKIQADIDSMYVTEYYDLKLINARDAFYVIGSDVYGPMGNELIPFANEPDAREFMKDHKGKKILKFDSITPRAIKSLD
ncbi:MAG: nitrous oxide reductase accessory protein NosL [Deltaproteobacteria bacterium]|nr:nitrous oxide reductase accessory protein NosL [Deltaproteobacteria bacterium]